MPGGIIIHGPIGAGKTLTCLELVKKARASGLLVEGIVSPRAFEEEEVIGYDCLSVATMKRFPLVRMRERAYGKGWFTFNGIRYCFSFEGFKRANRILLDASESMRPSTVVFVDEFGRLEAAGLGLVKGASSIASALSQGGAAVFACRTSLLGIVQKLLSRGSVEVEAVRAEYVKEAWKLIRKPRL